MDVGRHLIHVLRRAPLPVSYLAIPLPPRQQPVHHRPQLRLGSVKQVIPQVNCSRFGPALARVQAPAQYLATERRICSSLRRGVSHLIPWVTLMRSDFAERRVRHPPQQKRAHPPQQVLMDGPPELHGVCYPPLDIAKRGQAVRQDRARCASGPVLQDCIDGRELSAVDGLGAKYLHL